MMKSQLLLKFGFVELSETMMLCRCRIIILLYLNSSQLKSDQLLSVKLTAVRLVLTIAKIQTHASSVWNSPALNL